MNFKHLAVFFTTLFVLFASNAYAEESSEFFSPKLLDVNSSADYVALNDHISLGDTISFGEPGGPRPAGGPGAEVGGPRGPQGGGPRPGAEPGPRPGYGPHPGPRPVYEPVTYTSSLNPYQQMLYSSITLLGAGVVLGAVGGGLLAGYYNRDNDDPFWDDSDMEIAGYTTIGIGAGALVLGAILLAVDLTVMKSKYGDSALNINISDSVKLSPSSNGLKMTF